MYLRPFAWAMPATSMTGKPTTPNMYSTPYTAHNQSTSASNLQAAIYWYTMHQTLETHNTVIKCSAISLALTACSMSVNWIVEAVALF